MTRGMQHEDAASCVRPASRATRAGCVMSVTLGVILAHTGTEAFALIQPHTSCQKELRRVPVRPRRWVSLHHVTL